MPPPPTARPRRRAAGRSTRGERTRDRAGFQIPETTRLESGIIRRARSRSRLDAERPQVVAQRVEPLEVQGMQPEGQGGLDVQGAVVDEDGVVAVAVGDAEGVQVDGLIRLHLAEIAGGEEGA